MKTTVKNISKVNRQWHQIDAQDFTLGRMASKVARILMGKHKVDYTPYVDMGDFVVVINGPKVRLTGNKLEQKLYDHYSGFPGGMRLTKLADLLAQSPGRVVYEAVRGMLPKNRLRKNMLGRLKVYLEDKHTHKINQKIK
jgi:large subunit ribosomal protein L13